MYENYSRQAMPDKNYRELLGTAICVFNSNNAFIIENLLNISNYHDWWNLMDQESGTIAEIMKSRRYKNAFRGNEYLFQKWHNLVLNRNRIIHSFQVTSKENSDDIDGQILFTKVKESGEQFPITKEYLIKFIKDNSDFAIQLDNFRNTLSN